MLRIELEDIMNSVFNQVITKKMECPICLTIFTDPKSLSCSHTYCKSCLERLLESQIDREKLPCPICRGITIVAGGDLSQLEVNERIRSLLSDASDHRQICTTCRLEEKPAAESYCLDCDQSMCCTCLDKHADWVPFSFHVIIPVYDILSGKTLLKRRPKCKKHPNENEECYCVICGVYVCFRCGVRDHAKKGHEIMEGIEREKQQQKTVENLVAKAEKNKVRVSNYMGIIKQEQQKLREVREQLEGAIDMAYEEAVNQLTHRKTLLRNDAKKRLDELENNLQDIENTCQQRISSVEAASALVGNGLRVPLDKDALMAHDTLCEALETIIGTNIEEQCPLTSGMKVEFCKKDGLVLGDLVVKKAKWELRVDVALPDESRMNGMAATLDGRVAVGCNPGGLHLYTPDGELETKIGNARVTRVDYLSDGKCVVRDPANNILMYTSNYERMDVKFSYLNWNEYGEGGLTVDNKNNIYLSYSKLGNMQVFSPSGGKPVKMVPCNGSKPWQMFALKSRKAIVVQKSGRDSIAILDKSGSIQFTRVPDNNFDTYGYPAVCQNDNVLIAWIEYKKGVVTINEYSPKLELIKTLISNFQIQIPPRHAYYLQVFKSGEVAFCTKDHLYIFHET